MVCGPPHLAGSENPEHQWDAEADQLLGVVLLLHAGEVLQQGEDDLRPALLLGAAQRLQPHVALPGDTYQVKKKCQP